MNRKMQINSEDFHWLLLIAKKDLRYTAQRETYNRLLQEFRKQNIGKAKTGEMLGHPLSLTEGVYQD